jgi:uncharacterized phage-associated protein
MPPTVRAIDVAEYILSRLGPMSAMKLQKLVYYSQAWALVWTESPLFDEDIQAWANGPVIWELYCAHRGRFKVEPGLFQGDPSRLSADQKDVIGRVLSFYGDKDPQWLSNLTHLEAPWQNARVNVEHGRPSSEIISKESMLEYYSSL